MSKRSSIFFLLVLGLVAVMAVASLGCSSSEASAEATTDGASTEDAASILAPTGLPKLVDLGSNSCVPCRLMASELEALAREYAGSVDVVVVDVYEYAELASQLGVRVIPTQIFLSPEGKILARHEGFFSKEDMVSAFEQLGYPLLPAGVTPVT